MRLAKAKRILKEIPWIKAYLSKGGVFSNSNLPERQLVNYVKGQLAYISFKPFGSLNLHDTARFTWGDTSIPEYRRPFKQQTYIIRWHYHDETPFSRQLILGKKDDGSLADEFSRIAEVGDFAILDAVVRKIIRRDAKQELFDSFDVYKVPVNFGIDSVQPGFFAVEEDLDLDDFE